MKTKKPTYSDQEVVQGIIDSDRRIENYFYNFYSQRLKKYLFTNFSIRNKNSDDFVQETLLKAIEKIRSGHYKEMGSLRGWIGTIAHNLVIDHFRKRNRVKIVSIFELVRSDFTGILEFEIKSLSLDPYDSIKKEEQEKILHQYILELGDNLSDAVICICILGERSTDYSIRKNINLNTVNGRIFRAKELLREIKLLREVA